MFRLRGLILQKRSKNQNNENDTDVKNKVDYMLNMEMTTGADYLNKPLSLATVAS